MLKLGGGTLAALRLPAALFGAATVLPFYGTGCAAPGAARRRSAGTAILAFSASNLQLSRVTVNNIVTPFFWAVCFFFLLRGLRGKRRSTGRWPGSRRAQRVQLLRHAPATVPAARLFRLPAGGPLAARLGISRPLGCLALGYLAGFGPLLAMFLLRPGLYLGAGREGLTWNHIPTSWDDLQLMWNTLWPPMVKNLLGFSTTIDQGTFYWGALLLPRGGGAAGAGRRAAPPALAPAADFLLLMVGAGVLLVGGTLVGGVPFMQHWTPAFPASYAAIGAPVGALAASLPAGARRLRAPGRALAVALLALGLANVDYYFHRYEAAQPEFRAAGRAEPLGSHVRARLPGPHGGLDLETLRPGD